MTMKIVIMDIEVDVEYPKNLHDSYNDLSFLLKE